MNVPDQHYDYDWLVIGSGFGGSVSALRLAEKGYSVGVMECGRRYEDGDLPRSTWDLRRYFWNPRLGLRGIFRLTYFKDVSIVSGCGVGGGSLGYANTLYVPPRRFFDDPQWSELGNWEAELAPHYDEAQRMLGVVDYDQDDPAADLLREFGEELGVGDTYSRTRVGVFLGEPGKTVPDPYFDGEGPAAHRLHALRALHGRLPARRQEHTRQELPLARRAARREGDARAPSRRRPPARGGRRLGRLPGHHRASGAWLRKRRRVHTARGVVIAAGPLGTNKLLANCRHSGSLPQPLAAPRRAGAHQQRGHPRRHRARRRRRLHQADRDHLERLPRSRHPHRDRDLRREGRRDQGPLHAACRRRARVSHDR